MRGQNFSVKTKLTALTVFFVADLAIVGALSLSIENRLIETTRQLAGVSVPSIAHMGMVDMMHDGMRGNVLAGLLYATGHGSSSLETIRSEQYDFDRQMRESFAALKGVETSSEIRNLIEKAGPDIIDYLGKAADINALSLGGNLQSAKEKLPQFEEAFEILERDLGALGEAIEASASAIQISSEKNAKTADLALKIVVGLGLILGSLVSWMTIRSTMRSVSDASTALGNQADAVGHFASAVDLAANELARTVEDQARSVQRTAATVHQISEMARLSADNALSVRESASSAVNVADNGKARVNEMARIFAEISRLSDSIRETVAASNQQMASVVKVIQEIATKTQVINEIVFQTKLLSFNASVEAARAGEHGKGFAVVAEEVGNLARSSGAAAEQISSMLTASIRDVEEAAASARTRVDSVMRDSAEQIKHGEATAQECNRILDHVVDVSRSVQDKVDQISGAIREQSVGVQDMSKTLQSLEGSIAGTHQQSLESATNATGMAKAAADMHAITATLRLVLGHAAETSEGWNARSLLKTEASLSTKTTTEHDKTFGHAA